VGSVFGSDSNRRKEVAGEETLNSGEEDAVVVA
jgi:hypothetical protein